MCAGKHMVCVQKQDGTFKMEETLIQMLFINREVSLKQPREGSSPECGENHEESQLRGAVLFLGGYLEGRELEKSRPDLMPLLLSGLLLVLTVAEQNPSGEGVHWGSLYWSDFQAQNRVERMKGSFENYCLPKSLQQPKGMWTTVFSWSLERLAASMWWRWGSGSRLFQSWAMENQH